MGTLLQDVRYGVRMWTKAPVVSAVAAVSLALGIAANTSIFAVLSAFLFEPLPYHDQDGLVLLRQGRQGESVEAYGGISVADFRDFEEASRGLSAAMLYTVAAANLTGVDVPEQLQVVPATPNVFDVLGVQPALGRGFRADEGTGGRGSVLVLEHDFWQRRFAGDPGVLGRTLMLDGEAYTVIGVMPAAFDMIPANVHAFRPTDFAEERDDRAARGYVAFGRLAPGATAARVQQEVEGAMEGLAARFPETHRGRQTRVVPVRDFFPGSTDTKLVMILAAVALFGLLIACANVANLLLARAEERQKEVALRTALGAGRGRILRQLLTESLTLGAVAGVLGLSLAVFVVRWLQGIMPAELPRAMVPQLDARVLAATVVVSLLAGVAFGLAPSIHAARGDLREALGEGSGGGTASRSRRRLRNAFVVGEFAVALALLTGAGLLVEMFDGLMPDDPGFRQEGLLTFTLAAPDHRYPGPTELVLYQDELVARLEAIPGVEGVAVMSTLPRGFANPSATYTVEGRPEPAHGELPVAGVQSVSAAFFATMGIALVAGRGFDDTDRLGSGLVAVVNQALADREFPGEDAVGRTLRVRGEVRTIVGVAADALLERIPLAGRPRETLYLPFAQEPLRSPAFALRSRGEPTALAGDVRQAIWSVNPDQPVARVMTLDEHVAQSLAGPRSLSIFLGGMGVIALALAAMGIYGVMAHSVAQQRREIGIRMALGAGRGAVVAMVTRTGLGLAGAGMLLGLPLAYLMYRGVASALDIVQGDIGLRYAIAVTVALGVVATVSTWFPAQRASGVSPGVALRE